MVLSMHSKILFVKEMDVLKIDKRFLNDFTYYHYVFYC